MRAEMPPADPWQPAYLTSSFALSSIRSGILGPAISGADQMGQEPTTANCGVVQFTAMNSALSNSVADSTSFSNSCCIVCQRHVAHKRSGGTGSQLCRASLHVAPFHKELVMNACWTILLAVLMPAVHLVQVGIGAPAAAPPAPHQSQMAQSHATSVQATPVNNPGDPLPPSPQPCPCYVPQPCPCDLQQPCGNVAPWSWQHDNQNDGEWPADHGG